VSSDQSIDEQSIDEQHIDEQRIELDGTRVLIAGGTSGLGLAMAGALARAGATVVLTSRSAERAAAAAARLPAATGIEADARDEASVARAVDQAWSRLGGIDMLVNNAGLGMKTVNPRFMIEPRGFWDVPADGFRALSRIMAADLDGTGVTVNLLLPGGATETGMLPASEDRPPQLAAIDPAVMGPPIVWLASRRARDVHDQRIVATSFGAWLAARVVSPPAPGASAAR
jgi:NAD(P)-dependent dehydrogenase (short-subunit alcohol dehydrogenase family)